MQVCTALQIGQEDPHDAVYNCQLKDDGAKMKIYDGKSKAKLGTKKNPAVVRVQTEERRKDVAVIFEEKGWDYKIDLEPDKPEEITALEVLLNTPKTKVAEKKIGRNALCPCGSGQKHKRCCGR